MNKKFKITIIAIIATILLAMYITSIATSFSVGDAVYIGMGFLGETLKDSKGNDVKNAINIVKPENFDYFCAKRGVDFGTGGQAFQFKNIAKVEITGNTAKLTAGREYANLVKNLYKETYVEEGTNANNTLALLFYKIKDGKATIDEVDENGRKTGNRVTITRTRDIPNFYGFPFDFGQWAMWRNLIDWRKNVGTKMDKENETLWNKILNVIQSEEPSNKELSDTKNQAYQNGKELYEEVVEEASKINVNNEFGIEETYYNTNSSNKSVETRVDKGNDTILGPFKYNFVGTIENGKPILTFNTSTTSQPYTIGTYVGSTFTQTNKIVSGNEFYIKVPTTSLAGVTSIHFNFQVEGISLYNTTTTLYFFERVDNIGVYQPVIHIEQDEGHNKPFTDSYKISKLVEVTLEKLNESGNKLKAEGIKFQIKDNTNTVIAYIKTDANGNGIVTDINGNPTGETKIKLLTNQTYTLIEKENQIYGYKKKYLNAEDVQMSGAEINQSGNNIKFALKQDCPNNVTIKAKNEKELAKLELQKNGEDGTKLENVVFVIKIGTNEYLQLKDSNNQIVTSINKEVTINSNNVANSSEYHVEYVKEKSNATQFVTDKNGKIIINNLEVNKSPTTKYSYTALEVANPNYGYDFETNTSLQQKIVELEINKINKLEIVNTQPLGNIELTKVDKDNNSKVLKGVEFILIVDTDKYIQLKDKNGNVVERVEGTATINKNNKATEKQYSVEYTTDSSNATKFITNSEGKLGINNLKVYSSGSTKHTYKLYEIANPNHGYTIHSFNIESTNIQLENKTTQKINAENENALGGLEIIKVDKDNENILLKDIEFVLSIDKDENTYVVLYNQEGKLVKYINGTAIINSENKANSDEYNVKYVKLDKPYLEYTESEREELEVTVFKTDENGKILINNLEVKNNENNVDYTYRLTETYNPYYGYEEIDGEKYYETKLTKGTIATMGINMTNTQEKIKISGYVWIENPSGKTNGYDCVYTEGDASEDIKLTDLYVKGTDGKLQINNEAETKVEIKLRDKATGAFIKEVPDEFDTTTGKYTFVDVEIENLANYEVVFVYNGFYYTTVVENLTVDNGSKVKEVSTERKTLNDKFVTVKDNSQVVGKDGTVNTVVYNKEGHTSTLSKLNFNTNLTATTGETKYDLKDQYNTLKTNATNPVEVVDNVNMGIVLREQPQISMRNDIHSVLIDFEGYQYNYKYNGRQNYYDNVNGDDIGVKFEQENAVNRYTRTVYASDVQAAADQGKNIKVSVTYKMQIVNESRTLSVMPKQIINYFDARYNVEAVGLELNEETHTITNELTFSEPQNISAKYKSTVINFGKVIGSINSGDNAQEIYVTFDIQRAAIIDLLNGKSTYHNASEIYSYASYYGEDTNKVDEKQFMTEMTEPIEAGSVYAGIDKVSQPGNMELRLVDYKDASGNTDGTQILDTSEFENDTSSAPSLILEATGERKLSGTIWEDSITYTGNNEKLGDGIYNSGEKPIKGVTVFLHKLNVDGTVGEIATYSNGEQTITETDENGNYTFGYYDEENEKYVGILPGKYIIKYTYNNEDYIDGNKNIDVNDYKSTIITSEVIKNAYEGSNERWYLVEESNRYSDARDDISLRPEYDENGENIENITTTNNTVDNGTFEISEMDAYTPKMDIGLEFTEGNEANVLETNFVKEVGNIDFGIVERPNVDIVIDKKITGLELIAQNGTVIIPKGDPSDPGKEMQYVRTGLDGLVTAEIETNLLQGAQLNLEYAITVTNNSDRDYLGKAYYYYGNNSPESGAIEATPKPNKVIDYLDITMPFSSEQNGTTWVEDNAEQLHSNGYISEEVYNELVSGNYNILITEAFKEVGAKENKTVQLNTSRYLAISDSIREENKVEIIEITGTRTSKNSTPGNYIPTNEPSETDEDKVVLTITPPTGTTVNYIIYIISGIITLIILVTGVVIIKKKIIR